MTRILLDSHALFWFIRGNVRLSQSARKAIEAIDAARAIGQCGQRQQGRKFRVGQRRLQQLQVIERTQLIVGHAGRVGHGPVELARLEAQDTGGVRVVAGEAVDRPDLLCMGEIRGAESNMARHTLESRVRRRLQFCGVDVQRDRFPLPGHRRPPVRVTGKTFGAPPGNCRGGKGEETGQTQDGSQDRRSGSHFARTRVHRA